MQRILIIGATSAIAERSARIWAARGAAELFLAARNEARLAAVARDLEVRGAGRVVVRPFEAGDTAARHAELIAAAWEALGRVDAILIAHGDLPDQAACEADPARALAALEINASSAIALMTLAAPRLEAQGSGTLAVISSPAGDRGRAGNYVYGAAKAAVSAFASGLGQRLARSGVAVVTLKPGFVDTPMTAALKKGPLWSSPERVATGIVRAMDARRPIAYVPGWWWAVMLVVRLLPERVFRKRGPF